MVRWQGWHVPLTIDIVDDERLSGWDDQALVEFVLAWVELTNVSSWCMWCNMSLGCVGDRWRGKRSREGLCWCTMGSEGRTRTLGPRDWGRDNHGWSTSSIRTTRGFAEMVRMALTQVKVGSRQSQMRATKEFEIAGRGWSGYKLTLGDLMVSALKPWAKGFSVQSQNRGNKSEDMCHITKLVSRRNKVVKAPGPSDGWRKI
jgi:hypothetical protein